jgi:hypothetical protein
VLALCEAAPSGGSDRTRAGCCGPPTRGVASEGSEVTEVSTRCLMRGRWTEPYTREDSWGGEKGRGDLRGRGEHRCG